MTPQWSIDNMPPPPTVEEIRRRFDYHTLEWQDIRDEAKIDMRFATGDPWEPNERNSREGMGRLCLDFDELGQYINQLINGVRQNKRAPKVTPTGNGANDKTAEMLAGLIKAIGYKSNANTARVTAFENAAMRSYGYTKIVREYVSDDSDDQELRIRRIPNPDVISLDPDAKEADFSDMEDAFELDQLTKSAFKSRFPDAEVVDFSSSHMEIAPTWIKEDQIQIATYWKAHINKRTRYRLDSEDEPEIYADELPEGSGITSDTRHLERKGMKSVKVRNEREIKSRFVVAYLTNGIEILETRPWTLTVTNPVSGRKTTGCTSIPIIPYLGKELWVDKGSGTKRVIQSLIRMARTPYMAYCYTRTAQLEEIQMTSKSPYWAVEGQLENHETEIKTLNKLPRAVQEYKATTEATGAQILGPPTRPDFVPNVQLLEVYAQAARQSIQAAIGVSNPQAQRDSSAPLSGKALDEFESQGDRSTFHFIDNYDRALEREAFILKEAIPVVYDTEREISISGNDDKPKTIQLNNPAAVDKNGQPAVYLTDEGDHDVTLSVGPSYDSERDAANEFSDTLVNNPQLVTLALQSPQSTSAKLLAQAIRLKDLGPVGDAMADTIDPPQDGPPIPPQVQQAVQQMQQKLQQAMAMVGTLQQELKEKTNIAMLEMQNKRVIAADKNRTDLVIQMLKDGVANAGVVLQAELERIENSWQMLHESELAPTPSVGPQGIHPVPPPPQETPSGSEAEPAMAAAQ